MPERISQLREHIQSLNAAGVRRTTFFSLAAESLRRTAGAPLPIRRAQAFAHLLDSVDLIVLPHELITGSVLGLWSLAEGLPSFEERRQEAQTVVEQYLAAKRRGDIDPSRAARTRWALMERDHYDANIAYEDLQQLTSELEAAYAATPDLTPREIGRELEWHFNFDYADDRELLNELPWATANHVDLNYQRVVKIGLCGLRNRIIEKLETARDADQRTFYRASRIAIEAVMRFAHRYAARLEAEADGVSTDATRSTELRDMAAVCRRVADQAPATFREALQLMWLVHIAANIDGGNALSFARFDQYMHPFYRRDVDEGILTREQAGELVACMWLKVNEPHMRTVQSICLGGTTPGGACAVNDLTRLCLQVCRRVRRPYPNTAARISADCPDWYLDEITETVRAGFGQPMILNDDVWVPNLARLGYSVADARDYYNMGCVEIMVMGKVGQWQGVGGINLPKLLDEYLHDAVADRAPSGSFDAFLGGYLERIESEVDTLCQRQHRGMFNAAPGGCDPFGSALLDDCLEKGLDMFEGGGRYPNIRPIGGNGLGTATDSLSAIRTFVFEQQRLRLPELVAALDCNFDGHEALRVMLDRATPCFGNDIGEADELAARVFSTFGRAVERQNRDGRGPYVTVFFTYTGHVYQGEAVPATANGRRAADTLSNGVGPTQGKDLGGPTKLLNSICGLDHSWVTGAYALNLKFTPSVLADAEGQDALTDLLKAYLQRGGPQVQINVLNQDDLLQAQQQPERFGDLVVRVGGYSEYFVKLDRKLQNEIIRRNCHTV